MHSWIIIESNKLQSRMEHDSRICYVLSSDTLPIFIQSSQKRNRNRNRQRWDVSDAGSKDPCNVRAILYKHLRKSQNIKHQGASHKCFSHFCLRGAEDTPIHWEREVGFLTSSRSRNDKTKCYKESFGYNTDRTVDGWMGGSFIKIGSFKFGTSSLFVLLPNLPWPLHNTCGLELANCACVWQVIASLQSPLSQLFEHFCATCPKSRKYSYSQAVIWSWSSGE